MNDDELVRLDDVRRMLGGVAKSTLYYWQKRNAFPRGIHLGDKTVAWRRRAIRDWVAQRERQAA